MAPDLLRFDQQNVFLLSAGLTRARLPGPVVIGRAEQDTCSHVELWKLSSTIMTSGHCEGLQATAISKELRPLCAQGHLRMASATGRVLSKEGAGGWTET